MAETPAAPEAKPEVISNGPAPFVDEAKFGKPAEAKTEAAPAAEAKPEPSNAERIHALAEAKAKGEPAKTEAAVPAAGSELTDDKIAAAVAQAAEVEEIKAKVIQPEADFSARAKQAEALMAKGDVLGAMRALGMDLDKAVKQQLANPDDAGDDDPVAKENAKLKAENKRLADEASARTAREAQVAQRQTVITAILADAEFPYITTAEQADEALKAAAAPYKAMVEKEGRDLTPSEKDRLVRHVLAQHNAKAAPKDPPAGKATRAGSTLRSGTGTMTNGTSAGKRKPVRDEGGRWRMQ